MIEQLVAKVFMARDAAHIAHWATGSRSDHFALGEFYSESIGILDDFVECYQGAFEKIGKVKPEAASVGINELLSEQVVWIGENVQALSKSLPPLDSILADLMQLYLKTLYQLNNLS